MSWLLVNVVSDFANETDLISTLNLSNFVRFHSSGIHEWLKGTVSGVNSRSPPIFINMKSSEMRKEKKMSVSDVRMTLRMELFCWNINGVAKKKKYLRFATIMSCTYTCRLHADSDPDLLGPYQAIIGWKIIVFVNPYNSQLQLAIPKVRKRFRLRSSGLKQVSTNTINRKNGTCNYFLSETYRLIPSNRVCWANLWTTASQTANIWSLNRR